MADKRITDLAADTAPTGTDLVVTVDDVAGTPTTKKATLANLTKGLAGATGAAQGVIILAGDLGGTAAAPQATQARGLRETAGPTTLAMGAVADGQFLQRSGATVVGAAAGSEAAANARPRRLFFH